MAKPKIRREKCPQKLFLYYFTPTLRLSSLSDLAVIVWGRGRFGVTWYLTSPSATRGARAYTRVVLVLSFSYQLDKVLGTAL